MINREKFLSYGPPRELKEYYPPTLNDFLGEIMIPSIKDMMFNRYVRRKQGIIFGGPPGAGKSTTQEIVEEKVEEALDLYVGNGITRVNFDTFRDDLKERGEIHSNPNIERTKRDLGRITAKIRPAMRNIFRNPNTLVVSSELPIIPRIKIAGRYRGADVGASAFYQLTDPTIQKKEIEEDEGRELPPYDIYLIYNVPGGPLREAVAKYRHFIKKATTLEEMMIVTDQFTFAPHATTEQDRINIPKGGARLRTMDSLRQWQAELIEDEPRVLDWSRDPRYRENFGYLKGKEWKSPSNLEEKVSNIPIDKLHLPLNIDFENEVQIEIGWVNRLRRNLRKSPYITPYNIYVLFDDPQPKDLYTRLAV